LQNDAFLSTGTTTVEAFDRLEVAEFAAGALASLQYIGESAPIEDKEMEALNKKFLA